MMRPLIQFKIQLLILMSIAFLWDATPARASEEQETDEESVQIESLIDGMVSLDSAKRNLNELAPHQHCRHSHSNPGQSRPGPLASRNTGIKMTISCSSLCKNQKSSVDHSIVTSFFPAKQGLEPGDGYMEKDGMLFWGSLSTVLPTWAESLCLKSAADTCGGLTSVDQVQAKSFKSGKLRVELPLPCSPNNGMYNVMSKLAKYSGMKLNEKMKKGIADSKKAKKVRIVSPFGADSGAELITPSQAIPEPESKIALPSSATAVWSDKENLKSCKVPMITSCCSGDCAPGNLLATGSPIIPALAVLCGDTLVKEIQKLKLEQSSDDVLQVYCDRYFANSVRGNRLYGSSCAAFRPSKVDCKAVISAIRNR